MFVGLFLPEEPSAHVNTLWQFLFMFTHPITLGSEQSKIKFFY